MNKTPPKSVRPAPLTDADLPNLPRERKAVVALQLKMAGLSCREIAPKLGWSNHSMVNIVINELLENEKVETVDKYRTMEVMRLDALMAAIWQDATAGGLGAIDRILKIVAQKSALLGLATPVGGGAFEIGEDVAWEVPVSEGQMKRIKRVESTGRIPDNLPSTIPMPASESSPVVQDGAKILPLLRKVSNGQG